jgi:hypothetical protein
VQRLLYNMSECNTMIKEHPEMTQETEETTLLPIDRDDEKER